MRGFECDVFEVSVDSGVEYGIFAEGVRGGFDEKGEIGQFGPDFVQVWFQLFS